MTEIKNTSHNQSPPKANSFRQMPDSRGHFVSSAGGSWPKR